APRPHVGWPHREGRTPGCSLGLFPASWRDARSRPAYGIILPPAHSSALLPSPFPSTIRPVGPRILARNRALLRLLSPGRPGAPTLCIVGPVQRTSFVRPPTALLILSYERQPDGRLVTAPLSLCIVGPVEQTSRV